MKRDDMVSGMIIFNIPVWSWKKNMNMVDEMAKKNESAKNLYQDKLNDIKARTEILVSQLVKWRDLYKLYKNKLIPQTELGLETILSRYRTSSVEFMPVIDSVRMLLRYRKELLMAKKEYCVSYSELHALLGQEILP
jgi:outer membrane protein TolC